MSDLGDLSNQSWAKRADGLISRTRRIKWAVLAVLWAAGPAGADSKWNTMIWGEDVWAVPEPTSALSVASGILMLAVLQSGRKPTERER